MFIEFIKSGVKSLGINDVVTVAIGDILDVESRQAEFFIQHGHAKIPTEESAAPWLDVDDSILGFLDHNGIDSLERLTVHTKKQLIDMPKLGKASVNKIISALGDDYVLASN